MVVIALSNHHTAIVSADDNHFMGIVIGSDNICENIDAALARAEALISVNTVMEEAAATR